VGPAIITIVLLVAIPVGIMMTGGVVAAILGATLKKDIDEEFEGTEHLTLS
jgi:hypothetical protein